MSGGRYTIVLAVILGLLAAVFFLFVLEEEEVAVTERVFELNAEEVVEIKVAVDGAATTIEKVPLEGWVITDPVRYAADPDIVVTLLREFSALSPARTVADSAEVLAEYGLEQPSASVEVIRGLDSPMVLLLGDVNPTGAAHYAVEQGTRRVFLISAQINGNLRKTTDALRDRRLMRVEQNEVEEIVLEKGGRRVVLRLDPFGTWRVEEPYRLPAERDEVINALGTITAATAISFVDDAPTSLAEYGLADPVMTATVKSGDGSVLHTLSLGNEEMGQVYAMTSERRNVYSVSTSIPRQLDREPDFYRRLTAFNFQSHRVPTFSMNIGDENVALVKHAFEDWRMTSPYELRANDQFITAMLDSLEIMRVRDHIPATAANSAAYGFEQPVARLSLTIDDRVNPQEIMVGSDSGDGQFTYVMDPAEEWIYAVDAASLQRMPASAIELRDNKILRFKGYEVHMFEVVTADERLRVRRDQKQRVVWKLEEPSTGDADAISVGRAFSELDSLYSEAFVTADPEADLATFGLDRPVMELTLQVGGRDNVPEERLSLIVGKSLPGDENLVYVKQRNSPVVSLARAGFIARINEMVAQTPKS
ncbi:MAG: DUF4340 domain-containing protein [Gemmatimonadetes bacterium]|nr:DUF4340 domain-containing protein [Gemmatimonadota bacterium]MYH17922.1 DUF4340 domain-containing protein [Gemmatimonadota bacterium]MYK97903.1 DUF4340 domain-containing protein [Gemmatimonadota bacterium]